MKLTSKPLAVIIIVILFGGILLTSNLGWFQTTTHENFRTPMRETRYAVMALAEAFPRPGSPRHWAARGHSQTP